MVQSVYFAKSVVLNGDEHCQPEPIEEDILLIIKKYNNEENYATKR
ncbi:hypothetical protein BGP_5819 [Beggiatoa sp. PS]|nr:hypothetical protein BGP_5819 [Beggiatoa sp. PS]